MVKSFYKVHLEGQLSHTAVCCGGVASCCTTTASDPACVHVPAAPCPCCCCCCCCFWFTATEKMLYGTRNEHLALSSYQQLAPHEALQEMGFALWGSDCAHEWLAASPDGLITARGLDTLMQHGAAGSSSGGSSGLEVSGAAVSVSEEVAEWVKQQTGEAIFLNMRQICFFSLPINKPYSQKQLMTFKSSQQNLLGDGAAVRMHLKRIHGTCVGCAWVCMCSLWV